MGKFHAVEFHGDSLYEKLYEAFRLGGPGEALELLGGLNDEQKSTLRIAAEEKLDASKQSDISGNATPKKRSFFSFLKKSDNLEQRSTTNYYKEFHDFLVANRIQLPEAYRKAQAAKRMEMLEREYVPSGEKIDLTTG